MIRQITIKNFRSIKNETIRTEEITTFVGKNDAGKSNILRALNLFFNNRTDWYNDFDFECDFNQHATIYSQRANEIVIELILKLPESYRAAGDTVYWKKAWRKSGYHQASEVKQLCDYVDGRTANKRDFPKRSQVSNLLSNINFTYIPAIKDANFFRDLQGAMYDALAVATEAGLHSSAKDFEVAINSHVVSLTNEINLIFNDRNEIKLPQNLRNIFSTLEFSSNNIPLNRRGDGVKIRHIPMILSFISDKKREIGIKSLIRPQIWGFEEPENNVEFLTCFELNKQIMEAAKKHTQVFITTHSPAIYCIENSPLLPANVKTASYYVTKEGNDTKVNAENEDNLHGNMGFIQLIAPIIEREKNSWREKEKNIEKLNAELKREIEKNKKPHIFLEGLSDKSIIQRLLTYSGIHNSLHIYVPFTANNCALAAADRAAAFYLIQKHEKEPIKGLLILDNDESGKKAKENFDEIKGQSNFVKSYYMTKSAVVISLLQKGLSASADIESNLPQSLWELARTKGWLEKVTDLHSKFSPAKIKEIFNNNQTPQSYIESLNEHERIIIDYNFTHKGKEKMAKHIESLSDTQIENLGLNNCFSYIVNKIKDDLLP